MDTGGVVAVPLNCALHERGLLAFLGSFLWDDPVDLCVRFLDLCDFCVSSYAVKLEKACDVIFKWLNRYAENMR